MKLAVIGDIHANAEALEAALRTTARAGYDLRVLIGDLLTYGVEVRRTLDLVADALKRDDTILILGNHDDIYLRLLEGRRDLVPPLSDWVAALIDWTLPFIPARDWSALPFRASFAMEGIYVSHANPFGPGDWSYLAQHGTNLAAADALRGMGMSCGVFGHTHRARRFVAAGCGGGDYRPFDFEERLLDPGRTHVLNAGSVGQPRSDHPREVVMWLDVRPTGITHRFEPLDHDRDAHRRSLLGSSLPEALKRRCLSFHRDAAPDGRQGPFPGP